MKMRMYIFGRYIKIRMYIFEVIYELSFWQLRLSLNIIIAVEIESQYQATHGRGWGVNQPRAIYEPY